MTRWLISVAVFAEAISALGCGYHLVGTASYLPEDLQTLHVRTLENKTTWPDMDQRLGEAVTGEFVRRRRFRLVEQDVEADVALVGTISRLMVHPVSFDAEGRAQEYQMTLMVDVRLQDVRGDEPEILWEDNGFSRRVSYTVDASAEDYFDRQVEAMDELAREVARGLVTAVLEGF